MHLDPREGEGRLLPRLATSSSPGPTTCAWRGSSARSRAVHTREDAAKMKRLYAAEAACDRDRHQRRPPPAPGRRPAASTCSRRWPRSWPPSTASTSASSRAAGGRRPSTPAREKFVTALAKDLAAHKGAGADHRRRAAARRRARAGLRAQRGARRRRRRADRLAWATAPRGSRCSTRSPRSPRRSAPARSTRWSIVDVNPVYTAPGSLKFADALAKAKTVIHAGVLPEETGDKATWHLPLAHFLESWGDARAWDGTASIVQPLILPLFTGALHRRLLGAAGRRGARPATASWWRPPGTPPAAARRREGLAPRAARRRHRRHSARADAAGRAQARRRRGGGRARSRASPPPRTRWSSSRCTAT